MGRSSIKIYPGALQKCLATSPRYERYALSIGHAIRRAAIVSFTAAQNKHNEGRVSEYTPPKYISSFRTEFIRSRLAVQVSNTDPGWALVEFGSHPGGNADAYVAPMKPLRRGLLTVVGGL